MNRQAKRKRKLKDYLQRLENLRNVVKAGRAFDAFLLLRCHSDKRFSFAAWMLKKWWKIDWMASKSEIIELQILGKRQGFKVFKNYAEALIEKHSSPKMMTFDRLGYRTSWFLGDLTDELLIPNLEMADNAPLVHSMQVDRYHIFDDVKKTFKESYQHGKLKIAD